MAQSTAPLLTLGAAYVARENTGLVTKETTDHLQTKDAAEGNTVRQDITTYFSFVEEKKAISTYDLTKDRVAATVKSSVVKVDGGIVYIKAQVGEVLVYIQAKLVAIGDSAVVTTLRTYATKLADGIMSIRVRIGGMLFDVKVRADLMSASVLQSVAHARLAVKGCVDVALAQVVQTYYAARLRIAFAVDPFVVKFNKGYAFASGKVGDTFLYVRAVGDAAQMKALAAYANVQAMIGGYVNPVVAKLAEQYGSVKVRVQSTLEPFRVKVVGGFLHLKGKIGDVRVYVVAQISKIVGYVTGVLEPYYVTLKDGYLYIVAKAGDAIVYVKAGVADAYSCARTKVEAVADGAKAKALKLGGDIKTVVSDENFRTTVGAAAGGAVAVGATGGATGLVAGGLTGAAVGLVPALFTFGLSIPIGAAVGSGAGLCVGTAVGGTMGLFGGGAAGYGGQAHKAEIGTGMRSALTKVSAYKDYVKNTARSSKSYVRAKLNGATGGTF